MKLFKRLLVVLLVLGLAPSVWAGPAEEVAALGQKRAQAFAEGNIDAYIANWADNAVFTSSRAAFRMEGKDAIRAFFANLFQQYPNRRSVGRQISFRVYGDNVVVANSYADQTWTDRNGQTTAAMARLSATWMKIGGQWQTVDAHVSKVPGTQ